MLPDYSAWDEQKINEVFSADEVRRIISIPFNASRQDRYAWRFEKHGRYTMKLGYIVSMRDVGAAYVDDPNALDRRWRWVWCLDITPKVCLFMWNVHHGIVPSTVNLIAHFVNVAPKCKRCGEVAETTEHALRDCPTITNAWNIYPNALLQGSAELSHDQ
ncbi:hypothetical protein ACS0TY_032871 [Phlomoides rotata]